jgi:hypothetical protein
MRITITALALAAGTLAMPAHSGEAAMTAGDLKELCSGTDHVSRNVCRIYILGITEGISQGMSMASGKAPKPCIPDGVSAERLEQTVKARLEEDLSTSTARGTADAASFLAAALAQAFPCSRPNPAPH